MRKSLLTSTLLLSTFAVACSDTSTAPTTLRAPQGAASTKTPTPQRQFRLVPGTFNPKNLPGIVAEWRKFQGEKDLQDDKYYALFLQKDQPTAANAAAGAEVQGVAGMTPAELLVLAWDHRVGTYCGAGAPRWNIYLHDNTTNKDYVTFLGCTAATHTAGGVSPYPRPGSVWIRDSWTAPTIQAEIAAAATANTAIFATSVVTALEIVFDEGPAFVYLDNIQVNQKIWTSPRDNNGARGNDDGDDDDDDDHGHGKNGDDDRDHGKKGNDKDGHDRG
jgi:hypothetical protein